MGKNNAETEGYDTMTLELDGGETIECLVVTTLDVNGKQYIALVPMNEDGSVDEQAPVYLYEFIEHDNDEVELLQIEDDDEFEAVSDAYDEFLDNEEFEEVFGDF